MPIPVIAVLTGAGKVIKITVKAGTAIFRLVRANPRLTAGTITAGALSHTITTYSRTEQEKIQLIREIFEQNPDLAKELAEKLFPRSLFPFAITDIFYLILLIIVMMFILKIIEK